ncbi:FtsH protease activity modulator HflK [Sphingomicrobium astaxanthinifaciens]|uniref:FtsH protease activity modulator HflK n=1 Tax=Sphingomicrobium astaxanthinifaciens TaxID=1227949 RepID=UPI001FCB1B4C|nr:FtsH protease activity modulator HflK [Sphingomicrobium astaxanthinifaciens]MCJ7421581.1 FtsH protease activity modulator HflK [Sphingomicrobium astaxanthinifaciens]
MSIFSGWRAGALFSDSKGPWGPAGGGASGGGGKGGDEPPKGPWRPGPTPPGGGGRPRRPGNITSLDEWLKGNRARFGGGGPGGRGGPSFPGMPKGSVIVWAIVGLVLLLLLFSTVHRVAPEERGVVTRFGRYVETLSPGIGLTLPAPIDRVSKVDVEDIRNIDVGSDETENLMLTGDENIIDIAYQVRWKIRDPEKYLFELANQEDTVRQVAESAMRQVIAQASLQDAIGEGRSEIQARVQEEMQQTLDGYRSGIEMRGVEIKRADPPEVVNEAFKQVTAAQQDAQSFINQARAYALQLTAQAQGEAEAFDKVYEEYRLAPEVTRQRLYYETMERVLRDVDKTIIEAEGVQPYLPLNQLQRQARPSTSAGGGQ